MPQRFSPSQFEVQGQAIMSVVPGSCRKDGADACTYNLSW